MTDLGELPRILTDRTAFLLQLALGRAQQMGERALERVGVSGREYGLLALLRDSPSAPQHQLGATLGFDRTTTMSLLAGLQARGLVVRTRDPGNRRAYLITLTAEGERVRSHAARVLTDCDRRFLAPLTPRQRAELRIALQLLA